MNAVEPIEEDGDLPAALRALEDAVSRLIDPQAETLDGQLRWLDSLYDQLVDEIPGQQGTGHGVARSLPPLCIDATDLKNEIDTAVACWEPKPLIDASRQEHPPITVIRLQALEKRLWRPQDCHGIDQITTNIQAWVEAIKALLTPARKWTLPNACPACSTAIVYRKNSAGESVRQPALQIGPLGCACANCHAAWAPEYFQHLANVLGYKLPDGVLE